jgi:hypothetical protein
MTFHQFRGSSLESGNADFGHEDCGHDTQLELQLTSLETIMAYMTSLTWLGLNEQSAVNPSKPLGSWS